jgi:hypothetical protein
MTKFNRHGLTDFFVVPTPRATLVIGGGWVELDWNLIIYFGK